MKMAYTQLIPRFTPSAQVDEISSESSHYRLTVPSGKADKYRVAQLDDYTLFSRRQFPHRFPLRLNLSARTSSDSIPGTWGFGLWNDPFGMSLGFGGNPFRLPALPNAVWFFGASEENYLSFKSPRAEWSEERSWRRTQSKSASSPASPSSASAPLSGTSQREIAANGFLAQTFRSPRFHPLLVLAGLALPFSRKVTRRLMSQVIAEDGVALSVDPRQWHGYRLEWRPNRVSFEVDDVLVFESPVSPNPPLGLVIWIDNQYAAFTPEGRIGFGVLENPEPAWLEVKDVEIK
jgi:hypothetical protein